MGNDTKRLVVIGLILVVLFFLSAAIFTCSLKTNPSSSKSAGSSDSSASRKRGRGGKSDGGSSGNVGMSDDAFSEAIGALSDKKTGGKSEERKRTSSQGSYSSYYSTSSSSYVPDAVLSEAEIKAMEKHDEKMEKELEARQRAWLKELLEDPNVDPREKEKFRLRGNRAYVSAVYMMRNGDYKDALQSLNEAMKDPLATPVSKYFILSSMMEAAIQLRNKEIFAAVFLKQAQLIDNEDLGFIGIAKDGGALENAIYQMETLDAEGDPVKFNKLVLKKIAQFDGMLSEQQAEEYVRADIEFNKEKYKELL
ncbi:MAG: hypothetical protein GX221_03105 [Candidatus Riflebacteria bacterium]|nr:hypothetical protein [Candidatus Riflebacteria bacterium]